MNMQVSAYSQDQRLITDEVKIDKSTPVHESGFAALCVEFLLYLSIILRAFGWQLGIMHFQGLSGGIVAVSGLVCLVIMIVKGERLPLSFWFILLINILADVSELYVTNDKFLMSSGPKNMLYWLSWSLMACYIVRDNRAYVRFTFFLSFCVIVALALGMNVRGTGFHSRVTLEGQNVATMFANSNELAQLSCVTAIALLFYSFRSSKFTTIFCVATALVLAIITLKTVSRQGLILLLFGLLLYFVSVVVKRKGKAGFVILLVLALIAVNKYTTETTTLKNAYGFRFSKPSTRTEYFKTAVQDMSDTFIFGKGSAKPYTVEMIEPHNTFLWIHVAYGGVCAWAYLTWIFVISWKTFGLTWRRRSGQVDRFEILALIGIFVAAQQVLPFAPSNFGSILALAIFEKNLWARRLKTENDLQK